MFVEDRVQVVVVSSWRENTCDVPCLGFSCERMITWITINLRGKSSVAVIHSFRAVDAEIVNEYRKEERAGSIASHSLVVSFPEFDGTNIGGDEDGAAQDGIQGSGKESGNNGLEEEHGRIWQKAVKESQLQEDSQEVKLDVATTVQNEALICG